MTQGTDTTVGTDTPTQEEQRLAAEERAKAEEQAEADFAAGFKKVRGDEPASGSAEGEATEKSAADLAAEAAAKAKAETEAKAQADAAAEERKWDGVPPIVRQQLEKLQSVPGTIDKLAGHIGGFKRQLDTAVATASAAAASNGAAAPSKKQVDAAAADQTGEKWKAMQSDFPEWAEAMEERLAGMGGGQPVDAEAITKQVTQSVNEQFGAAIDEAEERAFVRLKHPDWKKTVNTPEFGGWLKGQPADTQALARSSMADDALTLLDGFAAHTKAQADAAAARLRKDQRLQRAVTPQGTNTPPKAGISDEEAFNRGFKRVAAK